MNINKTHKLMGLVAGGLMLLNTAWGQGWVGQSDYATPYTFITIAGTWGIVGSADGTNGAALFNWPQGVVVTTNDTLYVVDWSNNNIREMRKLGTNWVVTTIAGLPGAQSGFADGTNDSIAFNEPTSIAIDGAGNLYVTDADNNTIRKLTQVGPNWVSSTIAGTASYSLGGFSDGTNGVAQFNYPSGIAVDASNNVYVSDTDNSVIRQLTPVGTNWVVTTIAGITNAGLPFRDGTNQNALFDQPAGLAVDRAGNVFVSDTENYCIRKITPEGTNWVVTTIAGTAQNANPGSVADGTNGAATFYSPYYPPNLLFGPMGIAVDANDNLYVADGGDELIRKVSPVGTNWVTTTLAGLYGAGSNDDGTGTNATFGSPGGIAVDAAGTLFVADDGNIDIREGTLFAAGSKPNLAISRAAGAGGVAIWWLGSGATLQTNASLRTTNWGAYGGTVNSSNGTNSVIVPAPAGSLFFRLSE
jgi:sugar lactone lactonase YvrE